MIKSETGPVAERTRRAMESKQKVLLEALLTKITEQDLHEEAATGPATGKEAW